MFINISLLHHHLSQEGIYTSCIKHSVRIQNDEISSLNHGVFFYTVTERIGNHCLLMSTFLHCSGTNNLLSKLISHTLCSVMFYNHLVRFWLQYRPIFYYFVCFFCFSSRNSLSCVRACVRACVRTCVCVCVCFSRPIAHNVLILSFVLGILWTVVGALSLSVQLSVNCYCLWLLIAGAK